MWYCNMTDRSGRRLIGRRPRSESVDTVNGRLVQPDKQQAEPLQENNQRDVLPKAATAFAEGIGHRPAAGDGGDYRRKESAVSFVRDTEALPKVAEEKK